MTPNGYMIFGAVLGIFMIFTVGLTGETVFAAPIFMSGALFGKGYGIWEERSRKGPQVTD
jgi:hypothetical protein